MTQIEGYTERVKRMVGKVLTGNGITRLEKGEADCVFCALEGSGRVLLEKELALHQPEWNAVVDLLKLRRQQLSAKDASISGWNVGLNSGLAAGQTVFHAHWHLIPRRDGDCEEPRGGVRGVIAGRQGY